MFRAFEVPWRVLWRGAWSRRRSDAGLRIALVGLTTMLAFCGCGYLLVGRGLGLELEGRWTPISWIDRAIPAWPPALLPYFSFYLVFCYVAVRAMRGSDAARREWMLLCQTTVLVTAISFVLFVLFPCEVQGRAELQEAASGVWRAMVDALHVLDAPTNAWPSLHISLSLLHFLWIDARTRERSLRSLHLVWFVLLSASVLLTKQHYVFDFVTGSLLAIVLWCRQLRPALRRLRANATLFDERLAV